MATFEVFAARMRKHGENIEENVDRLVKKVAITALQNVVVSTPVDTGRARSGWGAGIGSSSPGHGFDQAGQGTVTRGRGVIGTRRAGQDIFISNNVPYITRLNEGSSAQAPAMFVQSAINQAVSIINREQVVKKL